ncbi:MAG: DUF2764 family protein [Bacteroidales bacterium]|jgi:hypothetical protein|nr:DUF2764 domain-containing protein [Bacteroidales bacterium]MDD3913871.1 DUF2764 family protein [Bacteroidales bacterium]MDD4634542.1 DUF2764 family protein [Bacteroidales bacterium]
MSRNYYCLIAGMPEIVFDQKKLLFKQDEFKTFLQEGLHPDDFSTINNLYYSFDNENIINILIKKENDKFNNLGNYGINQLTDNLKEPENLVSYLKTFVEEYNDFDNNQGVVYWEKRLQYLYYNYLKTIDNQLLKLWFEFEFMLKTITTAINARKYSLNPEEQLIIINEDILAIAKSGSKDFGLSIDLPVIEKILLIYESDNLMKREEAIDMLKWQWLDDATTFEYFSFELVIAILIKLRIADRWFNLDTEKGKLLFTKLLNEIKSNYKFENQ